MYDRVLDGARIRAGDRVAEVGGGSGGGGSLTQGAVDRVGPDGDVVAVDSSVDALEELRASTAAPNLSYFVGYADVLPLMDESVDVVLIRSALRDNTEAARELFRVLTSGGRISIYGEGELGPVFAEAGFSDVRTEADCLTAVKP